MGALSAALLQPRNETLNGSPGCLCTLPPNMHFACTSWSGREILFDLDAAVCIDVHGPITYPYSGPSVQVIR